MGHTFFLIGAAISILWIDTSSLKYILPFLIVLFSPYLLAYGIIIPLLVIRIIIQWPVEYIIINKAKQKLKIHTAVK